MSHPNCTAIVPCYNYGRYLAEALESALHQTLPPQQIIVVDDGSRDDTRQVAERFTHRGVTYVYQENQGLSAARNTAIRHSSGDYIALLDADDAWHPRKLEAQLSVLQRDPQIAALGTDTTPWPGPFAPVSLPPQIPFLQAPLPSLVCRNYLAASSVVIRREAIRDWEPEVFDTALRGAEDWDCWLRIAENWKIGNIPLPLTGFRDQVTGLGTQPHIMGPALQHVLHKLEQRGGWRHPDLKRRRSHAFAHLHFSVATMHAAHGHNLAAIARLFQSTLSHPSSIERSRAKLAAVSTLRLLKLKQSHSQSVQRPLSTGSPARSSGASPKRPRNP
jgi:glycosyltransferase involved in cell wall biosynthesis